MIPEEGYQPSDYWYVRVSYGSCCGCDTLQSITDCSGDTALDDLIDNALLRRFSMIHEVTVPEDAVEAARVARRLLDDIGEAERSTPRVSYGGRS